MKTDLNPTVKRAVHSLDASGQIFGVLAVKTADLLRGKKKISFVHHLDVGDFVIIKNIDKISFSGNKLKNKKYYRHTGYIGNLKEFTLEDLFKKNPEKLFRNAVKNMLPDNRLRKQWLARLKFEKGNKNDRQ